ncbi:hypothetical protein KIL84_018509 [Mauremys mutica]|uniref:Uncharacterized protein n=1 Tax=Mauremys mutica TaxID=74926 RepID=A0A9D4B9S3_9SAUR|nr:hypothetical protein KIL84_018509 [Mauremys mutica]
MPDRIAAAGEPELAGPLGWAQTAAKNNRGARRRPHRRAGAFRIEIELSLRIKSTTSNLHEPTKEENKIFDLLMCKLSR